MYGSSVHLCNEKKSRTLDYPGPVGKGALEQKGWGSVKERGNQDVWAGAYEKEGGTWNIWAGAVTLRWGPGGI